MDGWMALELDNSFQFPVVLFGLKLGKSDRRTDCRSEAVKGNIHSLRNTLDLNVDPDLLEVPWCCRDLKGPFDKPRGPR